MLELADVVKLLLIHKANIEHVDLEKDSPLSEAITERHLDVVKTLIDAKANIDCIYGNGNSALILATLSANPKTVELLLEKKAELNHVNDDADTAISIARSERYPKITLILEEEASVQQRLMRIEDQVAKRFNANGSMSLFWQSVKRLAQLTDRKPVPDELKSRPDIMEAVQVARAFIK